MRNAIYGMNHAQTVCKRHKCTNEIVCINTSSRLNLFVLIAITDIDPKFIFGKVVIWLFDVELPFMPVIMMFSYQMI